MTIGTSPRIFAALFLLLLPGACAEPTQEARTAPPVAADATHTSQTPPVYREPGEIALTREGLRAMATPEGRIWLPADEDFVDAVVMGESAEPEGLRYRALLRSGTWSDEQALRITWQEDSAFVARMPVGAAATGIELILHADHLPEFLLLDLLDERPDWSRPLVRDLPLAEEEDEERLLLPPMEGDGPLNKGLSFVVTRAQWGARNTGSCGTSHSPTHLTIHHTATPNNDSLTPAARMRQMQAYHVDALGWCDFGYHFTVGIDGRVYRGRVSERRTGSHVGRHNTNNVGVSVVGNFVSFNPRQVQRDGLQQIGAWITSTYAIPLNRTHIRGHRDWPGHRSNACPGDRLYAQLSSIIAGFGGGAPSCSNECTPGAWRCTSDSGTETCADHDGNGCTTWGAAASCSCGEFCADGVCVRDPSVCCPAPVAGGGDVFTDLLPESWAERVASRLLELEITSGCQSDPPLFCPNCEVTRGQAAAFLARALELDTEHSENPPSFEDVPTDHPFHGAIEALFAADLITGCAADPRRFCPDEAMPRGTAAGLLARAAGLDPVAAVEPVFSDVPEEAWYRPALETAHRACMVAGCATEPLSFCPNQAVTRVQFGALMLNFLELGDEDAGDCCRPEAIEGGSALFGDMPEGRPETAAAESLLRAEITQGCRQDPALFCGACMLERGAAAALLVRALDFEEVETQAPTFADVPLDHRFASAIETLAARGLITGCDPDAGLFCPERPLTRAATASLLDRVFLASERDGERAFFSDVPPEAWYADAVETLAGGCVLEGCDVAESFCPGAAVQRGTFALWLARALELDDFENCLIPLDEVASEERASGSSDGLEPESGSEGTPVSGSESPSPGNEGATAAPADGSAGGSGAEGSGPGNASGAAGAGAEDRVNVSGGGCAQAPYAPLPPLGEALTLLLLGALLCRGAAARRTRT